MDGWVDLDVRVYGAPGPGPDLSTHRLTILPIKSKLICAAEV